MERCDVYDANRRLTGRTMVRGEAASPLDFHLVVHVCLFNRDGDMLIQKRTDSKQGWPGLWDVSVGGSVLAGETSPQAAVRETKEELGWTLTLTETRPHFSLSFERGFDDFYVVTAAPARSELMLQADEVADVRWASETDILRMIDEGTFIPYKKAHIALCFAMQGPIRGVSARPARAFEQASS